MMDKVFCIGELLIDFIGKDINKSRWIRQEWSGFNKLIRRARDYKIYNLRKIEYNKIIADRGRTEWVVMKWKNFQKNLGVYLKWK